MQVRAKRKYINVELEANSEQAKYADNDEHAVHEEIAANTELAENADIEDYEETMTP